MLAARRLYLIATSCREADILTLTLKEIRPISSRISFCSGSLIYCDFVVCSCLYCEPVGGRVCASDVVLLRAVCEEGRASCWQFLLLACRWSSWRGCSLDTNPWLIQNWRFDWSREAVKPVQRGLDLISTVYTGNISRFVPEGTMAQRVCDVRVAAPLLPFSHSLAWRCLFNGWKPHLSISPSWIIRNGGNRASVKSHF